ncbi:MULTISPECIES: CBO0543 family protein [Paenibacillus]|uniref:Uncharacterized protein n=1 Tax=Paenibacillus albilobatus TaxID=2716884 RepID=A0A920CF33_9BACL|nr:MULTISPECIES: CBO0543 family protein [Paenibacillus]GIO34317.1 hypothetical protein J2TS6_54580 [Paenibacillus albilobatus]
MISYEDVRNVRESLAQLSNADWLLHSWGTWQWWMLLSATIVPWIIAWKFMDKNRGKELLILGMAFTIISLMLDNLGTFYSLWGYSIKLIPLTVEFVPGDCSIFPVTYIFMNQFSKNWRSFVVISVVAAAFFSYIIEPFFKHIGIYRNHSPWSYTWSFVGFIIVFIFVRFFAYKLIKKLA